MNKRQAQKVNMIDSTVAFLNTADNKTRWVGNASFNEALTNIINNMGAINQADILRLTGPQPFTETKGQAKVALINTTMLHAAAGIGYAASTNNTTLKAICTIGESYLSKTPDADLGNTCIRIYKVIEPLVANLSDWNIDTSSLTTFLNNINTFNSLVGSPKAQISMQHAAAKTITELIGTIETILTDTIDTLMLQFKAGNPTFYEGYLSARKTHKTGIHHNTTFEGIVYNTNNNPLAHIEITLQQDGKEVRKHFTDQSGHYRFTRLYLGNYTLMLSSPGYQSQTKTFQVETLQKIETNFRMQAES